MKRKYKIILASQDPGGFNAIAPVIKALQRRREFDLTIFLANQSRDFAKKKGIKYLDANKMSFVQIRRLIENKNPDLVFTATSEGPSIEKQLIKIAKKEKIPTASMVDFWSGYPARFGNKMANYFEYLSDYLLAIDEIMRKEMIAAGVPKQKIIITGNPFFDFVVKKDKKKEKRNLAAFFCQPFSELGQKPNEIRVLKDIVGVLEKVNPRTWLIVKFHPRAKKLNKFDKIIRRSRLSISIEKKLTAEELIEKSEVILGMSSMVLFQAALLGKKVLSYQPNMKKNLDPLVSNKLGLSLPVYKKEDFLPALNKIFSGKKHDRGKKLIEKYTKNKSTQKVVDFITGILNKKKIVCVVQARTGSTRLPGKVLMDLEGKPVLLRVVDRLLESKKINQIVVATTNKKEDEAVVRLIKNYNPKVEVFQGSENDVTDRYYKGVKKYSPEAVIRITADCPLIDPEIVDKVISEFRDFGGDYVANVLGKRTYPRGLDVEVFSFKFLEKMWKELKCPEEREHITLFVRRNPSLFKCKNIINPIDYSFHRWTLDEEDDYKLIKTIYQELYKNNPSFRMEDILDLFKKKPELIKINQHVEQKNKHY